MAFVTDTTWLQIYRESMDYLTDLYLINKELRYEDVPEEDALGNQDIAACKHLKKIFGEGKTRVPDLDPAFYEKVCKRSLDACTKHPVILMGNWGQGKSSTVNALLEKEEARVGRRNRTTEDVSLFSIDAGDAGTILLADTPGLEPDKKYDILSMFRKALQRENLSPDVLTDFIILVIAGNAQGIRSLTSKPVLDWIEEVYMGARGNHALHCTLQPVITHRDQIHPDDLEGDKSVILDRLKFQCMGSSTGIAKNTANCSCAPEVFEPIFVQNPDKKSDRKAIGIDELRKVIQDNVIQRSNQPEFKKQWSMMLTQDLRAVLNDFRRSHPYDETEERLFHRAIESVLATYGKRPIVNVQAAFQRPSWHLLHKLECKLRNEETQIDRMWGKLLQYSPRAPNELWQAGKYVAVPGVGYLAYSNRQIIAKWVMNAAKRIK
jgi:hypothetical protein